jgi:pimeloyl-ACP methyl ester carboxylesterase
LAKRGLGSKLVLVTPISSLADYAQGICPSIDCRPILDAMDEKYDNINKAKEIKLPTLILHGEKDTTVPYEMAVSLSTAFPNAKLITLNTDKHKDIYKDIDEAIWLRVRCFICS